MSSPSPAAPSPAPSPAAAPTNGHGFGTTPVFLAAISTVLGAVMFLRFGYAVGHLGLAGSVAIIVLGHLITVPTAMALSEIATNRRVEGGGEYFIISRSFGVRIGAAIGVSLYLSQAISVAFYCIAFAEAFQPLAPAFESMTGVAFVPRMVSIPITVALIALMLTKGAALGVKALYGVVAVLAVSLVLFFAGAPVDGADSALHWNLHIEDADGFFVVFAICFPAFTGMTAGVGLSGDLAKPSRSIPLGTLLGTLVGLLVYLALVWKLSVSVPPDLLASDPLVMGRVALWSPIIPIGLGCATLSSAIGSILVAPRTLQALGRDETFVVGSMNRLVAHGVGASNEPRNATVLTAILALVFVSLGDVDVVARLISMFFMVTYGALCTASFLEHFAASPGYRPSFRSRWYLSLLGAAMCLLMMFQMDPIFAALSLLAMAFFYWLTRFTPAGAGGGDLAALLGGVMAQLTRRLQVRLQRAELRGAEQWRPSVIMVNERTFTGSPSPARFLGWLSTNRGFGTYLHFVKGFLDGQSFRQRRDLRARLMTLQKTDLAGVFVDVMVSPSMRSAIAQTLQVPGVSGVENNSILLECKLDDEDAVFEQVVEDARFAVEVGKNVLILRHGERHFRKRRTIHLWLTWDDQPHAAMMVLLAYVLLDDPEWRRASVHVYASLPSDRVDEAQESFLAMISEGRLPISANNIDFMPVDSAEAYRELVKKTSADADLVIRALTPASLASRGPEALQRHPHLQDLLFVTCSEKIVIQ